MRTLILLLVLLLPPALPAAASGAEVREGDLLFVTASNTGLSGAINEATRRSDQLGFDHVAMVAKAASSAADDGTLQVLHADSKGSREQSLAEFSQEARDKQRQVMVYRLKAPPRNAIGDAVAKARTMLGKPYNTTYVQSEDSYYCSDFIERAFRAHHVFHTQPMNFRNVETGEFPAHWQTFYAGLGMQIPQGEPGTNPNDMAAAPVLERVGPLY